jgi:hypothetical protein
MEEPQIIGENKNPLPILKIALIAVVLVLVAAVVNIGNLANQQKKVSQSKASELISQTRTGSYIEGIYHTGHTHKMDRNTESVVHTYTLTISEKNIIDLHFDKEPTIPDGSRIRIYTTKDGLSKSLQQERDIEVVLPPNLPAPFVGTQRVVVIHGYPETRPQLYPTMSVAQLANPVFHDANSAKNFFREVSVNQADIVPALDPAGNEVHGPYVIPLTLYPTPTPGQPPINPPPCGDYRDNPQGSWLQVLLNSMSNDPDPQKRLVIQANDRLIFFYDSPCESGSGGTASFLINGQSVPVGLIILSGDSTQADDYVRNVTHELGHTAFLPHSNSLMCYTAPIILSPTIVAGPIPPGGGGTPPPTPTQTPNTCIQYEYGDRYDMIGGFRLGSRWQNRMGYFSGPDQERTGWMSEGHGIQTISQSGNYTISYFEKQDTTALKVLKIPRGNNKFFYVEFRQPYGFDAQLNNEGNDVFQGALIHIAPSQLIDTSVPPTPDFIDSAVRVGQTFTDPDTNTCIRVLSKVDYPNPNSSLTVQVNVNSACPAVTPTVTPSPTRTPTPIPTVTVNPTCIPRPQCMYVTLPPGVHKRCYMPEPPNMCP